jgi:hypothetical protein
VQKNPFVGTWKLISCNAFRRSGDVLPIYGKDPIGRLFYDSAGNMSVHIMRSGRPNFKSETKFRATSEEMRTAYHGYEAYFASYTIDTYRCVVHHQVAGGLFPNWTDTVQTRFFKFEGESRLVLSTEPIGAVPTKKTIVTLVWERLK